MEEWMKILSDILTVARVIIQAVQTGDTKTVEDVLPETAKTTLAKAAADARAKHKFG